MKASVLCRLLPTSMLEELTRSRPTEHPFTCTCEGCVTGVLAGSTLLSRRRGAQMLASSDLTTLTGVDPVRQARPFATVEADYRMTMAHAAEADEREAEWRALPPEGWTFIDAVITHWTGGSSELLSTAQAVASPADLPA